MYVCNMYIMTYDKGLDHMIMKAEKFYSLLSAIRDPRKAVV